MDDDGRMERRYWTLALAGILAGAAVLITIVLAIAVVNRENNAQKNHVAQECVTSGGTWIYNNCIR